MEEKMIRVPNNHSHHRHKRRQRYFPREDISATLVAATFCAYIFMPFGEKTPKKEPACKGNICPGSRTDTGPCLGWPSARNQADSWNLMLVNCGKCHPRKLQDKFWRNIRQKGREKIEPLKAIKTLTAYATSSCRDVWTTDITASSFRINSRPNDPGPQLLAMAEEAFCR